MSDLDAPQYETSQLPYRVAVLCYVRDEAGRVLLLHRRKNPNAGMYSPIGGKVEISKGESPHECAVREMVEETGVNLRLDEVRLCGMVSERAYEGRHHWLIFLFETTRAIHPSEITAYEFDEGTLEWVDDGRVIERAIPWTDREILWPAVQKHRGGYFSVDIDCSVVPPTWRMTESWPPRKSEV